MRAVQDEAQRWPRVGNYRVVNRLGYGGMAEILLARGPGDSQGRAVIKRILPQHVDAPSFRAMFLREARLLSALSHPNICRALEFGVHGGRNYLAVEYIHGINLHKMLERYRAVERRCPDALSILIGLRLAQALDYAHRATDEQGKPLGVVHRDVNPSNVMIGFDGSVKLLDFGIAKASDAASATRTGVIRGKLGYMAPEQYRSQPVDARTDLFAVGLTAYEMTTGATPYAGSEIEIANQAASADIRPPSARRPDLPPDLERVIVRCLQRAPGDRYATAGALANDLTRVCVTRGLDASEDLLAAEVCDLVGTIAYPDERVVVLEMEEPDDDLVVTVPEREAPIDLGTTAFVAAPESTHPGTKKLTPPVEIPRPRSRAHPVPASRRRAYLVYGVAGVAAAILLGWWGRGLTVREAPPSSPGVSQRAPVTMTAEPVTTAVAPVAEANTESPRKPSPPDVVTLTLDIRPATARVVIDGREVETETIEIRRDDRPLEVTVAAPGFETERLSITPSESQKLVTRLNTAPPKRPAHRPRRPKKREKKPEIGELFRRDW